eukprot:4804287-Amphidinium_carterae.1
MHLGSKRDEPWGWGWGLDWRGVVGVWGTMGVDEQLLSNAPISKLIHTEFVFRAVSANAMPEAYHLC